MLQMGSWSGVVVLPAFALSLGLGKPYVAGAPRRSDSFICFCYDFCFSNTTLKRPTKSHTSWDASGLIFIQAPSPVSWGWFLALLASPAYRQWAMQPSICRGREHFSFVCFFEDDVDLYSKRLFFTCRKPIVNHSIKKPQSFLPDVFSSFEIPCSKLYRSFHERLDLGTSQGPSESFLKGGQRHYWPNFLFKILLRIDCCCF